jgi:hypothetical protein
VRSRAGRFVASLVERWWRGFPPNSRSRLFT